MKKTKEIINTGTPIRSSGVNLRSPGLRWEYCCEHRVSTPVAVVVIVDKEDLTCEGFKVKFVEATLEVGSFLRGDLTDAGLRERSSRYFSLLQAIERSHAIEVVLHRAADILVSVVANTPKIADSVFCQTYSHHVKRSDGKLDSKARRDAVSVFNDLSEYIERNKSTYADWVGLAQQMNVDDSGVIAGRKSKRHLTQ